jgi:hypothetical protein
MTSTTVLGFGVALLLSAALQGQEHHPAAPTSCEIAQQEKATPSKALEAKDELSKRLMPERSVLGVGIGDDHSSPIIFVYVTPDAPVKTLRLIPKKCLGVSVSVVKSGPIKAQ